MTSIDENVLKEFMKALLDNLPFGVIILEDDSIAVMWNSILEENFTREEIDSQLLYIKQHNMTLSKNNHFQFANKKGILRKKIIPFLDKAYYCYFFFFLEDYEPYKIDHHVENFLKEIIELTYDGVVFVDTEGYVKMLTQSFADFLGVDREQSIGKHVTEVIENTRMHVVVKSGNAEIAQPQRIKDNYMVASRIPVLEDGEIVGAIGKVLFNSIEQISALSKRLRNLKKNSSNINSSRNIAYYTFDHIIGKSSALEEVKHLASKVAKSVSTVLIFGESGTGKELFAHAIHNESRRSMGAFVKVNCSAIPVELMESELFGYEEGSFTGAKRGGKAGKFELADGGTIFLDEIGELPLHMQVKLLRVLQEKEIERIGATGTIPVDVRVIAATNRNLEEMVARREFRLDLYYRLKVLQIKIPPLRERKEDITELTYYFINKYQNLMKKRVKGIKGQVIHNLLNYQWPGNIRELENTIERALNLVDDGGYIGVEHLPEEINGIRHNVPVHSLAEVLEEAERKTILETLKILNGNKSETARQLGVSRSSLYEKLNKYNLLKSNSIV